MPAYGLLHLCCNDPDSGEWRGKFREVSITFGLRGLDDSADLECAQEWKVKDDGNTIVIRRKSYRYKRRKCWVGNWCWDMYVMERRIIRQLVRDLRASGDWDANSGPSRWVDTFDRGKPVAVSA